MVTNCDGDQRQPCTDATSNQATLAETTDKAQDRKRWRGLASQIEKAAAESQTKNLDATWH